MASSVKFGTVKWYDPRMGYGFLIKKEGSREVEVFFHRNGARFIDCSENGRPFFSNPVNFNAKETPQSGAEIVFLEERKFRGPQAVRWGCAERWRHLMDKMDEIVPAEVATVKIAKGWGAEAVFRVKAG